MTGPLELEPGSSDELDDELSDGDPLDELPEEGSSTTLLASDPLPEPPDVELLLLPLPDGDELDPLDDEPEPTEELGASLLLGGGGGELEEEPEGGALDDELDHADELEE